MVTVFSTCCCVNSCIYFCSASKLLLYLDKIATRDVNTNGCSFLHLLLCELMHSVCKLLLYFDKIATKNMWIWMVAFFSTYFCVNSCIHLYSDGKLLSYLDNILTQDVWLSMYGYCFLHLLLCELMHLLLFSE